MVFCEASVEIDLFVFGKPLGEIGAKEVLDVVEAPRGRVLPTKEDVVHVGAPSRIQHLHILAHDDPRHPRVAIQTHELIHLLVVLGSDNVVDDH